VRIKTRAATTMFAAVSAIALMAAPAFAYGGGKPHHHGAKKVSVHRVSVRQHNGNVSVLSGNLSKDLNNSLNNNLSKNKVNVLSGDNINAPVTFAPNACGVAVPLMGSGAQAVCLGNYHEVNAGQNVGK
jgi:hypothetical protein